MPIRVSSHRGGREAFAALQDSVARLKHDNILEPITIIAPSALAGYSIRRALGRATGGVVNVQFKPLPAVLELIGSTAMAESGRRPLHDAYRVEAIRTVAEAAESPFGDVPIDGPLLRTLEQRFAEFDDCDDRQLEQIEQIGGMAQYLVGRYRDFRLQTAKYYTNRDLVESATASLQHGDAESVLEDIGSVIWYLPLEPTRAQLEFTKALSERAQVEVMLGLSGDMESVDAHMLASWQQSIDELASKPPTAQRIVQAPDAEEEVRTAIRSIAEGLQADPPIPLYRTAIMFRQAEPYARIAAEQIAAAGLTWNGLNASTLGQSLTGAVLSGLLGLWDQARAGSLTWRSHVAPWLGSAPIRSGDGWIAPIARWNQVARRANLQRGPDEWLPRLERYRATCADDLKRMSADLGGDGEDVKPGRTAWLANEIEQVESLAVFVESLLRFIRYMPAEAKWSTYGRLMQREIERLLGDRTAFAAAGIGNDEAELARWDDVRALLGSLDWLDELGTTTIQLFASTARRGLDRQAGHHGRVGEGIYVGPLSTARGMDWDVCYILGASDGVLPMVRREDPLITDEIRDALSLSGTSEHARRERAAYLSALQSADRRVLSYPRADVRAQRALLPSRWLLESATALNGGRRIYASSIDEAPGAVIATTKSFESAVISAGEPADAQEFDLRRLRLSVDPRSHYLTDMSAPLARGFEQQRERRKAELNRWNGLIEGGAGWALERPHSAGALQDWATCPYRYYLSRVLQIEEQDDARDDLRISALDRGSVIHQVLEAFFSGGSQQPAPEQEWTNQDRLRLHLLAVKELDALHDRGLTGRELLWRHDRQRILEDLQQFLNEDEEWRAREHAKQEASELAFGDFGALRDSVGEIGMPLSDGSVLQLRGIIDRLDRSDLVVQDDHEEHDEHDEHDDHDEQIELITVIDYKTGRAYPPQRSLTADPLVNGKYLQLPLYAYAVRRLLDDDDLVQIRSAYWFITERGEFRFHHVDWGEAAWARFEYAVGLIADGIRAGHFAANPGGQDFRSRGEHCTNCSFDVICPVDRNRNWDRVKKDPRLSAYRMLSEGPEEEPDEDLVVVGVDMEVDKGMGKKAGKSAEGGAEQI